jgi:predicted nucleic acid-binding protein
MPGRAFSDSNVLLYLLADADKKAAQVESLFDSPLTISVQVLNEIVNVARRKYQLPWQTVNGFMMTIKALCEIVPLTERIHDNARLFAERYQLSFYDACIVSAALESDSEILYSEDLHAGLIVDKRLRVINPFA